MVLVLVLGWGTSEVKLKPKCIVSTLARMMMKTDTVSASSPGKTGEGGRTPLFSGLKRRTVSRLAGLAALLGGLLFEMAICRGETDYLGVRSCSAVACHGNPPDPGTPQNLAGGEYVYWLENDPHARAYDLLSSPTGLRMQELLRIRREGVLLNHEGFRNCLACHNLTTDIGPDGLALRAEGVSCEACHGPAPRWVATHYQSSSHELDRAARMRRRNELGMANSLAPATRSDTCLPCHVGAADREVNHDLIAAGHPPLKFEMAAYHDALPKHWDHRAERRDQSGWEFELWLHGQLSAARQALALLATRAQRAQETSRTAAWPELSEYSCYACHHDLAWNRTRQRSRIGEARRPGQLAWSNWYFAVLEHDEAGPPALGKLRALMQRHIRPDPPQIGDAARRALAELEDPGGTWQTSSSLRKKDWLRRQLQHQDAVRDWDTAAQIYLLATAFDLADRDERTAQGQATPQLPADDPILSLLSSVRQQLRFPTNYDGPRGIESETSPLEPLRHDFQKLADLLGD